MKADIKKLAIKTGLLIDGVNEKPIKNVIVLIEDGIIKDVGNEVKIPIGTKIVDASGKTVMPGLIDAHIGLSGSRRNINDQPSWGEEGRGELALLRATLDCRKLLECGFTTVRDCHSKRGPILKKAVEEGIILGPRIQSSGGSISPTAGHADERILPLEWAKQIHKFTRFSRFSANVHVADGVEECRKAARECFREGADFIKIMSTSGVGDPVKVIKPSFTIDEMKAIVEEARWSGTFAAAHAYGIEGVQNAIKAGVKTIEHGAYIDEETCEMMKKKNVILVPTLSVMYRVIETNGVGLPEGSVRKAKEVITIHSENVRTAHNVGVKIATGTDLGGLYPHGTNAVELESLVKAGLREIEAIIACTKNGAEAVGLENDVGTIEPGKFADILIVEGNPIEDIKILQNPANIRMVLKDGAIIVNRGL